MSILQINNCKTAPTSFYKLGFLHTLPVKPLCYPDLSCNTKNFSMCRFPNTKWNARVYYDRQFRNCNGRVNQGLPRTVGQCDKYLFKI